MSHRRTAATLAAALTVVGLALAGCSHADDRTGMSHTVDASTETAIASEADITFAQMMIPHHQQAIEMAQLLLAKDGIDDRVRAIAQRIEDAQAPEIETMTAWLHAWGAPLSMAGMGTMDGMMSDADMTALDEATGVDAAQLFLAQMQEHHAGAIEMARDEIDAGSDPDAIALAQDIVEAQTAEIDEMKALATEIG